MNIYHVVDSFLQDVQPMVRKKRIKKFERTCVKLRRKMNVEAIDIRLRMEMYFDFYAIRETVRRSALSEFDSAMEQFELDLDYIERHKGSLEMPVFTPHLRSERGVERSLRHPESMNAVHQPFLTLVRAYVPPERQDQIVPELVAAINDTIQVTRLTTIKRLVELAADSFEDWLQHIESQEPNDKHSNMHTEIAYSLFHRLYMMPAALDEALEMKIDDVLESIDRIEIGVVPLEWVRESVASIRLTIASLDEPFWLNHPFDTSHQSRRAEQLMQQAL